MKRLTLPALLVAAASAAWITPAHAQIVTFDTISEYESGDSNIGMNAGTALSQTFTDVQEITNMTYQFVSTGSSSTTSTLTAYFVAWNTTTNQPASSTPIFTETFTVPPTDSASWSTYEFADDSGTYSGYDVNLAVDTLLDPSTTYAMILVDSTSSADLALMDIYNESSPATTPAAFNYEDAQLGEGYRQSGVTGGLSQMATSGTNADQSGSYGFAQLDVVPENNQLVPLPEPRAAAAVLVALFVAGLVGRQLYLRRRDEATALPAVCA